MIWVAATVALSILAAPPSFPPCTQTPTTAETRIVCMGELDYFTTLNKLATGWETCKSRLRTCNENLTDAESRPAVVIEKSSVSLLEWLSVVGIGVVLGTVGTIYVYGKVAK